MLCRAAESPPFVFRSSSIHPSSVVRLLLPTDTHVMVTQSLTSSSSQVLMAGFRFDPFRPMRATNTAAVFAVPRSCGQTRNSSALSIFCEYRLVFLWWSLDVFGPRWMRVVRPGIDKCCYKREVITGHSPPSYVSWAGRRICALHSAPQ